MSIRNLWPKVSLHETFTKYGSEVLEVLRSKEFAILNLKLFSGILYINALLNVNIAIQLVVQDQDLCIYIHNRNEKKIAK